MSHQWENVEAIATGQWRGILSALCGLTDRQLSDRHQPCPACGGSDRYRFDDKDGQGTYYCNGCGAGNGISLLMKCTGMQFGEAVNAVGDFLGADPQSYQPIARRPPLPKYKESPRKRERLIAPDIARSWLDKTEHWPISVYTARYFATPSDLRVVPSTGTTIVPIYRHGKLINAAAIAEDGRIAYAAGGVTFGGHSDHDGQGRRTFIAISWIDAWHVSQATGCACLACWEPHNMADVAQEWQGQKLIAAINNNQDEIATAAAAALDCIVPDGDDLIYIARRMQRKLYNPYDLLD